MDDTSRVRAGFEEREKEKMDFLLLQVIRFDEAKCVR